MSWSRSRRDKGQRKFREQQGKWHETKWRAGHTGLSGQKEAGVDEKSTERVMKRFIWGWGSSWDDTVPFRFRFLFPLLG